MTTLAIVACLVLSLFQARCSDRIAAGIFSFVALIFDLTSDYLPSEIYYLSAAACSLLISVTIVSLKCVSRLSLIMQRFCIASIMLNAFGWVIYMNYYSPALYNLAFLILYLILAAILLGKGAAVNVLAGTERLCGNARDSAGIRGHNNKGFHLLSNHKKTK